MHIHWLSYCIADIIDQTSLYCGLVVVIIISGVRVVNCWWQVDCGWVAMDSHATYTYNTWTASTIQNDCTVKPVRPLLDSRRVISCVSITLHVCEYRWPNGWFKCVCICAVEDTLPFIVFGHANYCHLADVAISAPFTSSARSASGSVYIYHSSTSATQILTINPQQVKLHAHTGMNETWHLR